MHDRELSVTQEVSRATETVQHTATVDAGRVGVAIDVDLNRGVHGDAAKTANDLRVVRDLLTAKENLVLESVPVLEEALEATRGETNRGRSGEVELAILQEVKERVLENLSPHIQVVEAGLGEATDNGVSNITDTTLQGEEVLRHAASVDLLTEEVDKVAGNGLRHRVRGRVLRNSVTLVALNDTENLRRVDRNTNSTKAVLNAGDRERLAVWRGLNHVDIMKTLEAGQRSVQFNNNLLRIVHHLGSTTNRGTENKLTLLIDGSSLNQGDVNGVFVTGGAVFRVVAIGHILRHHGQMLVEEEDVTTVNGTTNGLANLVRRTAVNHAKLSPPRLDGQVRRSASDQVETEIRLTVRAKLVLLDQVGQRGRDGLGATDTGKARPAKVHVILEVRQDILDSTDLIEERLVADTRRQHRAHC